MSVCRPCKDGVHNDCDALTDPDQIRGMRVTRPEPVPTNCDCQHYPRPAPNAAQWPINNPLPQAVT